MKRIRRADSDVDAERLRSADPAIWLEPSERIRLVEMVDAARSIWADDPDAETELDRLAPAARFPARLTDDRALAIGLTEKLTVSYRRSLAGGKFAAATGRDRAEVALTFRLSHCGSPSDEEDLRWLAAGPLA